MNCPRIEVDLGKIRHNTKTLKQRLHRRGIALTGVTKAVCGHPAIAQAMLDGGATGLADARISNVQRLRRAGLTCPITLIRTPMLSQTDHVVQSCDTSYNTELVIISALAAAAMRKKTVHGIILMVEMGDQRDGIWPENVADMARQVMQLAGVELTGIGANFGCLSAIAPDAPHMAALSELASEIEGTCGCCLKTVSGGSSANLHWTSQRHATGRINDLRIGEAILLGVEPLSGKRIEGMHTDAFTLIAEVIETVSKPAPSAIALGNPACQRRPNAAPRDVRKRQILALGLQDTEIRGLSMPAGGTLRGATSDHLVIETRGAQSRPGAEVAFQMDYAALMHAMAAPDMAVKLLDTLPNTDARGTPDKAAPAVLVQMKSPAPLDRTPNRDANT